jgi:hypothetical protein
MLNGLQLRPVGPIHLNPFDDISEVPENITGLIVGICHEQTEMPAEQYKTKEAALAQEYYTKLRTNNNKKYFTSRYPH